MTKHELIEKAAALQERLKAILDFKDLDEIKREVAELQSNSTDPNFWNDNETAQSTMQRIGELNNDIEKLESLLSNLNANSSTLEEAEDGDTEILELITTELETIEEEIKEQELSAFLSGKFDAGDAILTVSAGTGGTEAMDWADILSRMYTRYCNSRGWQVSVVDKVDGPEAGISSITMEIKGKYAFGYLKHEHGTHRLVRISPFNAAGQRQTSFAGVDVSPLTNIEIDIEIPDSDLEIKAVRSGGPGGQNVNKVSSAIRLRHIPTGILVASSGERNQLQNKETAMRILKAKLYLMEQEKLAAETKGAKGEYKQASWGNQIRNYVLQPYKLVKDTRTEYETSNADAVLDGDIQGFIDAEIRQLS